MWRRKSAGDTSDGSTGALFSRCASPSTTTGGTIATGAKAKETSTPAAVRATLSGRSTCENEVNNEVQNNRPHSRRDIDYHYGSQRANSRVTSTPNAPNVNNAVAKPNAAGATIEVPSHLGLSLVVTILSVVRGGRNAALSPASSAILVALGAPGHSLSPYNVLRCCRSISASSWTLHWCTAPIVGLP